MLLTKIKNRITKIIRKVIKFALYKKIWEKKISIISNNCVGTFLYREFGCEYLSPTINLQLSPCDYIKFCKNLNYYLSQKIEEVSNPDNSGFVALGGDKITFPVGKLDDLIIYFQHYNDFTSAVKKWEKRKSRINYDNMYFILIDTYCNIETVKEFFSLSYKNKLFMTGNKELLINQNCILIDTNNKFWHQGDWIKRFDFKNWFLGKKL